MKSYPSLWYNWIMNSNSPKNKVMRAVNVVHPDKDIQVYGTLVKGRFGGYFLAEVSVDGRVVARARHSDWRTAYKSLQIEFAKAWIQ